MAVTSSRPAMDVTYPIAVSVQEKMINDQFPVGKNIVEIFINEDDFREAFGKADGEA